MYPANQYMDPYYSHYRDRAPYPYYPPPGCEAGHPRMAMDSSYRPPSYVHWPYNASMSHLHTPEFHGCCNHTYPADPGYYSFRPPFPQELPPPHLYYHGPFPHHLNTCPSYIVPPPPYLVDQAPHGYSKFKGHCCGCPNHACHGGEKSNVKIEEERPEVKPESMQEGADNSSIIRNPNYQYPVIWLPSGNMKDKENGTSAELPPQFFSGWVPVSDKRTGHVKQQEQDDQKAKQYQWPIIWMPAGYDELKQEAKQLKEMDESPKVSEEAPPSPKIKIIPFSWFENGHHDQKPAAKDSSGDHNDISSVKNHSASSEHQDGRAMERNYKTTPLGPKKESEEKKPIRENYKTIPVLPRNDSDEKKTVGGNYRTIPVVSMKESDDKKPDLSEKKEEKKASHTEQEGENGKRNNGESSIAKHSKLPPVCGNYRTIPVMSMKECDDKKPDVSEKKEEKKVGDTEQEGENGKRNNGGSSIAKHSKLPHVCLRVDPLPRKKSANGSSRSLSPPTRKDADKAKEDVKDAQSQNQGPKQPEPKKEITVSEVKEKSLDEMKKGVELSNGTVQVASVKRTQEEGVPTIVHDHKVQPSSVNVDCQEDASAKVMQGCVKSTREDEIKIQGEPAKDDARICRISFSEPDAAARIQSTYRGYNVRRWQPLEKLRKIKNIHEQMQDVKQQLQDLETSSKKPMINEQVAIRETIMNLLLKLDTIQGSHPTVREARKTVARELICLQEKLDSLCKQPSGELNNTHSKEEITEGLENVIQTTTVSTEKASDEEKTTGMGEVRPPSAIDSKEPMHDLISSGVSVELRQDANSTEQKLQMEESSSTKEQATDEGKAAAQGQCQGASSIHVMNYAAFSGHSTEQKHQTEESNTISWEESPEEEKAAANDGQEVSSVDYMEPLHGAALSGSNVLKQCTASTEHNGHTDESNIGFSLATTEDSTAAMENEMAVDKAGSVEVQVWESAAVESSELKHDVAPAEDQCKESSAPFAHLEDSMSLKGEELHEHDPAPADDSILSNPEDQPEEARDANIQQQVADTTQDSTKEPDGTPEASMGDTNNEDGVTSADAEISVQSPLLEATSESDSAQEQIILEELEATKQCEGSGKDDSALMDQPNEPLVEISTGRSAIGEEPLIVALEKEADTKENVLNIEGARSDMGAEPTLPESESRALPCEHAGSRVHDNAEHDNPGAKVSLESQSDAQKERANLDKASAGMEASEVVECNEMLKEAPECATGANSAEAQADTPKEDATAVQTASEEAASASATHNGLKKDDDEKKLAEENQKLKEMLQKLLASGNDQMGVIAELSEKVKTLERKLARKKRPKVRVHRPARNATAKVH